MEINLSRSENLFPYSGCYIRKFTNSIFPLSILLFIGSREPAEVDDEMKNGDDFYYIISIIVFGRFRIYIYKSGSRRLMLQLHRIRAGPSLLWWLLLLSFSGISPIYHPLYFVHSCARHSRSRRCRRLAVVHFIIIKRFINVPMRLGCVRIARSCGRRNIFKCSVPNVGGWRRWLWWRRTIWSIGIAVGMGGWLLSVTVAADRRRTRLAGRPHAERKQTSFTYLLAACL